MTSLSRLPSEEFTKILQFLPENEIRRLRMVSKQFDAFFRDHIGLRLVITTSNEDRLLGLVERYGKISMLKLSNVTTALGSLVPWEPPIYLTSLTFHRIVASTNIFWAFSRFQGLKTLTFSHVILDTSSRSVNTEKFNLPCLRALTLFSKTEVGNGNPQLSQSDKLESNKFPLDEEYILSLLSDISCEKLSRVYLFCSEEILKSQPFEEIFDDRPFSHCKSGLTKLLSKNRKSLQVFVAGVGAEIQDTKIEWVFRPGQILWQTGMQLKYCTTYLPIPTDWTTIFTVQRNLEQIKLNGTYRHWTSLMVGIKKSHKTIRKIQLAGGGHGSSVDLEKFDKCEKLMWLDIMLDDCYLKNVHYLPVSLRHLYLNGPLREEDLKAISVKLENLEYFYLNRNLPSYETQLYGDQFVLPATITKTVLKGFLTLPKIHSLTFNSTRMQVPEVRKWLGTIGNIEVDLYPVPEYHDEFYASLEIAVPMRRY